MLVAFEKCKLKFSLESNISVGRAYNQEFNINSFLGSLIHKVLETYYKEIYDLKLFDYKWEASLIEMSKQLRLESEDDVLEFIKYWIPAYYPKKINTLKILTSYKLLAGGIIYPEKKVYFKNVYGIIDLYEVSGDKIRITDFKTGILFNTQDGMNMGVKEAYIEQLKTYGYIIYQTNKVQAQNIELVIKGLGNNEIYSFKCTHEEYVEQGVKIDNLINETNTLIDLGNTSLLATPKADICNFCNYQFECTALHFSIRNQLEKWEKIVLLEKMNASFDLKELSISMVVNDKTFSIHNIPEKDFVMIKKMNELDKEVLITQLFQVHNSNVKRWSKLTKYIAL